MPPGVYGKHPARGDFLEYGLPAGLRPALEGWLDAALSEARADLGAEWENRWAGAPMLRFWLGEGIWGLPVAGVLAPAQDRVGRRFPLVVLTAGGELPPPAVDPAQDWYQAAEAHLAGVLARKDVSGPAALIEGLADPAQTAVTGGPAEFWAVREGAALDDLWADVALTDHRRAAAGRSYWWVEGRDAPPPAGGPMPVVADAIPAREEAAVPAPVEQPVSETGAGDGDEIEGSPFCAEAEGTPLFAAPEPGRIVPAPPAPVAFGSVLAPRLAVSQVWAGPGLPSGQVIAWFLRGFQTNG
ncbi:MAG: type VI secretion system-associated protein TagF [Paracoccaceae bacterium]